MALKDKLNIYLIRYNFMQPILLLSAYISPRWFKIITIYENFLSQVTKGEYISSLSEANELGLIEFTYRAPCQQTIYISSRCELFRVAQNYKKPILNYFSDSYKRIDETYLSKYGPTKICTPFSMICNKGATRSMTRIEDLNFIADEVPKNVPDFYKLSFLERLTFSLFYLWVNCRRHERSTADNIRSILNVIERYGRRIGIMKYPTEPRYLISLMIDMLNLTDSQARNILYNLEDADFLIKYRMYGYKLNEKMVGDGDVLNKLINETIEFFYFKEKLMSKID